MNDNRARSLYFKCSTSYKEGISQMFEAGSFEKLSAERGAFEGIRKSLGFRF